jgi:uncharacterized protein YjbI with pentapeptide repeats
MRHVDQKHKSVGEQMTSGPSTRHQIPNWLIITLALSVIFVLAVAIRENLIAAGLGPFGQVMVTTTTTTHTTRDGQDVDIARTTQEPTPWDALGLLVIPIAGGLIVTLVSHGYNKRQREREEAVQSLRAQDEILQKYLDQMSDLVVDRGLHPKRVGSEANGQLHKLAQARTIAALLGLDSEHKRRPLKVLYELEFIRKDNPTLEIKNAGLDGANLSELTLHDAHLKCVDLRLSDLKGADLQGSNLNLADLRGSDLRRADLKDAVLTKANLLPYDERDPERWSHHNLPKEINRSGSSNEKLAPRRLKWARALDIGLSWHTFHRLKRHGVRPMMAKLTITNLKGATLVGAWLQKTWLGAADLTNADLARAHLTEAVLIDADLTGADLTDADLTDANLTNAVLKNAVLTNAIGVTGEQIAQQTYSLKGATMPNGTKYKEWTKDKARRGEDA